MKIAPYVVYFNDKLIYDPVFGTLRWRKRAREHFDSDEGMAYWNSKHAGSVTGRVGRGGYVTIKVGDRKRLRAHRIIWEMVNGPIPEGHVIDHINRNPSDNRLCNLRLATVAQNRRNAGLRKDNTTGVTGVFYCNEKLAFKARIMFEGYNKDLGTFDSFEEAAIARRKAEIRLYGEFATITQHKK